MKSFLTTVLYCVLYVIAGLIIAVPYLWLSKGGSSSDASMWTTLLGPLAALILIVLFVAAKEGELRRGFAIFWGVFVYLNLPIILRFLSMGMKALGWTGIAEFIFGIRFKIIPLSIASVIALGILALLAISFWEWLSRVFKRKPKTA